MSRPPAYLALNRKERRAAVMANPEASAPPAPYDILFEPVAIGPLVTRNRFFQVPHCNGMGYRDPSAQAAMRKVKAEGGWAVVCTEQVEIHPTSDITPFIELRIWDDKDLPSRSEERRVGKECR